MEKLIRRVRKMSDAIRPIAANLAENGLDPADFLEACDQLIAFSEGRLEEEVDVSSLVRRFSQYAEEVAEHESLMRQADAVAVVAEIPIALDAIEGVIQQLRDDARPDALQTALDLEVARDAALEKMSRGEAPSEEFQEMGLVGTAHMAELQRRRLYRSIALALYYESRPPEWWAALPPQARADFGKSLHNWQEQREELLGELPMADRRRLESLTPDDFDKPETWQP